MKLKVVLIFLLVTGSYAAQKSWRPDQQQKFKSWKSSFKKSYSSPEEEQKAMDSMLQNHEEIETHNKRFQAGKETFSRALWKQSDLSYDEKKRKLTGSKGSPGNSSNLLQAAPKKFKTSPASLNWTAAGLVHEVDDQQTCGSCYAFATIGVVEGIMLRHNDTRRVAVQQIIDCNNSNFGCGGGEPLNALRYAKTNGLAEASDYPYTSKEGKCKSSSPVSKLSSVGRTALNGNENRLKDFVANYGPVGVAIDAADSMMNYKTGVYNNPKCSKQQDHAVLLVGYGTDPKYGDYWLVKNSWGDSWGELGYIRMARNKRNQCGIASTVWFAT